MKRKEGKFLLSIIDNLRKVFSTFYPVNKLCVTTHDS